MTLVAALGFLLMGPGSAHAQTVAQAEFVHGNVTAARGGDAARALAQGGDVYELDTIRTAAAARAQLRFTDNSLVSLMPETVFSVQEYRLDADGNDGSLVFNLLSGGLRTVTGAIGKTRHEGYELKTPVGTLGIRGTEFTAVVSQMDTLLVHVGRGRVVLSNDHGELEVAQGQSAIMTQSQGPQLSDQMPDTSGFADGPGAMAGGLSVNDPSGMTDPMGLELPLPSSHAMGADIGGIDLSGVGGSINDPGSSTPPCDPEYSSENC